jgi:hypothetical protein
MFIRIDKWAIFAGEITGARDAEEDGNVNGRLVMLMIWWCYNMQRFRVINTTGGRKTMGKEKQDQKRRADDARVLFIVSFCWIAIKRLKKVNSAPNQSLRRDFSPIVFLGSGCHSWFDAFAPPQTTSVLRLLGDPGSTFVPGLHRLGQAKVTHG